MDIKNYFVNSEIKTKDFGNGIRRKILSYNDNLMIVEVYFDENAEMEVHAHPHEQITYIIEGEFEFNIDGNKRICKPGDSTYKQANIKHGAVCRKKGKLIDIFTPCRQDFLDK